MMSTLTAHCQRKDEAARKRTGHPPSDAVAKKMKSLTFQIHVCLRDSLRDWNSSFSCSFCVCHSIGHVKSNFKVEIAKVMKRIWQAFPPLFFIIIIEADAPYLFVILHVTFVTFRFITHLSHVSPLFISRFMTHLSPLSLSRFITHPSHVSPLPFSRFMTHLSPLSLSHFITHLSPLSFSRFITHPSHVSPLFISPLHDSCVTFVHFPLHYSSVPRVTFVIFPLHDSSVTFVIFPLQSFVTFASRTRYK